MPNGEKENKDKKKVTLSSLIDTTEVSKVPLSSLLDEEPEEELLAPEEHPGLGQLFKDPLGAAGEAIKGLFTGREQPEEEPIISPEPSPEELEADAPEGSWEREFYDRSEQMKRHVDELGVSDIDYEVANVLFAMEHALPARPEEKKEEGYLGGTINNLYKGFAGTLREWQNIAEVVDDGTGGILSLNKQISNPKDPRNKELLRLRKEWMDAETREKKDSAAMAYREFRTETSPLTIIADWYDKNAEAFKEMPETIPGNILSGLAYLTPLLLELTLTPEIRIAGGITALGAAKPLVSHVPKLVTLEGAKGFFRGWEESIDEGREGTQAILNPYKQLGLGALGGMYMHSIGVGSGMLGKAVTEIGGGQLLSSGTASLATGLGFGSLGGYQYWVDNAGRTSPEEFKKGLKEEFWTQFGVGVGLGIPAVGKAAGFDVANKLIKTTYKKGLQNFYSGTTDLIQAIQRSNIDPYKLRKEAIELGEKILIEKDPQKRKEMLALKTTKENILEYNAVTQDVLLNPEIHIKNIKNSIIPEEVKIEFINKVNKVVAENDPLIRAIKPFEEESRKLQAKREVVEQNDKLSIKAKEIKLQEIEGKEKEIQEKIDKTTTEYRKKIQEKPILEELPKEEARPVEVLKKPVEEVSPEKKAEVPEKKEKPLEEPVEKKEVKPEIKKGEEYLEDVEYVKGRKQAGEKLLKAIDKTREKITKGEEGVFEHPVRQWRDKILGEKPKLTEDLREIVTEKDLTRFEKTIKEDLIKTEQKLKELKEVEDAIQKPETKKVDVGKPTKPSEKVDEKVRGPDIKKETLEEVGEEKLDIRKSVGAAIEGFSKKAAKELKDLGILFSGGKFTKKVKPEGIIKFGIQKKTLQQEKRRVDVMRSVIKDVITENEAVLKRIHGRTVPAIMRKLENSKTPRSMNRAIDYIERVVSDKKVREEFISKENDLIDIENRVQKKTYFIKGMTYNRVKYPDSEVFSEMVDRIAGKRGKQGIKDIVKRQDFDNILQEVEVLENRLENPELTEGQRIEIQDKIVDLGFSGLYDMSAKQVKRKLNKLKEIIKGATAEGIAEKDARLERDVRETDWYIDKLAKKKFKKGEVVGVEKPEIDQTKINKFQKKYRGVLSMGYTMNNIPVILDVLSKYDPKRGKAFENQMGDVIMPKIWKAQMTLAENTETANKMIEDAQQRIFKPKNKKELRTVLKNNAVALKTPIIDNLKSRIGIMDKAVTEKVWFENKETGEKDYIDLNQNVALKYWMMLKDPSLDNTFFREITLDRAGRQRGMGWTDAHVEAIDKYLTPEMKKYGEFLMNELYPWIYEKVNPAYRRINGTDLDYTEFYTNISREGAGKPSSVEETISGEPVLSTVNNGSLLKRTGSTLPLRGDDVNRSMLTYMDKMLYYTSWAEPVRYLQKVFRNPRIRSSIKQWHKINPLKHMDEMIDHLAGKRERNRASYELVNGIRKRFIIGTIGLKGTVSIKQFFSLPAFGVTMGAKNLTQAVGEFMANPKKAWDITMENPSARKRVKGQGGDRDVVFALKNNYKKTNGTKDWVGFFMANVKYGDIAPIIMGYPKLYKIEYKKAIERKMSPEEAKSHAQGKAWNNVNMWQQSAETAYLSPMQLGNPYMKLFTMYMTAPLSYHRQATRAMGNLGQDIVRGRHKTSAGRKIIKNHIKRLVVAHVILPQLFTFAYNGLRWKDEDQLRALILGNISNLPFIGDAMDFIIDSLQGKPFAYSPTPVGSIVTYSEKLIKLISRMANKAAEEVDFREILESVIDVASVTTGIPLTGASNSIEGVVDVAKGETEDAWEAARRISGYSDYSLKEGKEQDSDVQVRRKKR